MWLKILKNYNFNLFNYLQVPYKQKNIFYVKCAILIVPIELDTV